LEAELVRLHRDRRDSEQAAQGFLAKRTVGTVRQNRRRQFL
jgi:hypothetical protein